MKKSRIISGFIIATLCIAFIAESAFTKANFANASEGDPNQVSADNCEFTFLADSGDHSAQISYSYYTGPKPSDLQPQTTQGHGRASAQQRGVLYPTKLSEPNPGKFIAEVTVRTDWSDSKEASQTAEFHLYANYKLAGDNKTHEDDKTVTCQVHLTDSPEVADLKASLKKANDLNAEQEATYDGLDDALSGAQVDNNGLITNGDLLGSRFKTQIDHLSSNPFACNKEETPECLDRSDYQAKIDAVGKPKTDNTNEQITKVIHALKDEQLSIRIHQAGLKSESKEQMIANITTMINEDWASDSADIDSDVQLLKAPLQEDEKKELNADIPCLGQDPPACAERIAATRKDISDRYRQMYDEIDSDAKPRRDEIRAYADKLIESLKDREIVPLADLYRDPKLQGRLTQSDSALTTGLEDIRKMSKTLGRLNSGSGNLIAKIIDSDEELIGAYFGKDFKESVRNARVVAENAANSDSGNAFDSSKTPTSPENACLLASEVVYLNKGGYDGEVQFRTWDKNAKTWNTEFDVDSTTYGKTLNIDPASRAGLKEGDLFQFRARPKGTTGDATTWSVSYEFSSKADFAVGFTSVGGAWSSSKKKTLGNNITGTPVHVERTLKDIGTKAIDAIIASVVGIVVGIVIALVCTLVPGAIFSYLGAGAVLITILGIVGGIVAGIIAVAFEVYLQERYSSDTKPETFDLATADKYKGRNWYPDDENDVNHKGPGKFAISGLSYVNGGYFSATSQICWHDPKSPEDSAHTSCKNFDNDGEMKLGDFTGDELLTIKTDGISLKTGDIVWFNVLAEGGIDRLGNERFIFDPNSDYKAGYYTQGAKSEEGLDARTPELYLVAFGTAKEVEAYMKLYVNDAQGRYANLVISVVLGIAMIVICAVIDVGTLLSKWGELVAATARQAQQEALIKAEAELAETARTQMNEDIRVRTDFFKERPGVQNAFSPEGIGSKLADNVASATDKGSADAKLFINTIEKNSLNDETSTAAVTKVAQERLAPLEREDNAVEYLRDCLAKKERPVIKKLVPPDVNGETTQTLAFELYQLQQRYGAFGTDQAWGEAAEQWQMMSPEFKRAFNKLKVFAQGMRRPQLIRGADKPILEFANSTFRLEELRMRFGLDPAIGDAVLINGSLDTLGVTLGQNGDNALYVVTDQGLRNLMRVEGVAEEEIQYFVDIVNRFRNIAKEITSTKLQYVYAKAFLDEFSDFARSGPFFKALTNTSSEALKTAQMTLGTTARGLVAKDVVKGFFGVMPAAVESTFSDLTLESNLSDEEWQNLNELAEANPESVSVRMSMLTTTAASRIKIATYRSIYDLQNIIDGETDLVARSRFSALRDSYLMLAHRILVDQAEVDKPELGADDGHQQSDSKFDEISANFLPTQPKIIDEVSVFAPLTVSVGDEAQIFLSADGNIQHGDGRTAIAIQADDGRFFEDVNFDYEGPGNAVNVGDQFIYQFPQGAIDFVPTLSLKPTVPGETNLQVTVFHSDGTQTTEHQSIRVLPEGQPDAEVNFFDGALNSLRPDHHYTAVLADGASVPLGTASSDGLLTCESIYRQPEGSICLPDSLIGEFTIYEDSYSWVDTGQKLSVSPRASAPSVTFDPTANYVEVFGLNEDLEYATSDTDYTLWNPVYLDDPIWNEILGTSQTSFKFRTASNGETLASEPTDELTPSIDETPSGTGYGEGWNDKFNINDAISALSSGQSKTLTICGKTWDLVGLNYDDKKLGVQGASQTATFLLGGASYDPAFDGIYQNFFDSTSFDESKPNDYGSSEQLHLHNFLQYNGSALQRRMTNFFNNTHCSGAIEKSDIVANNIEGYDWVKPAHNGFPEHTEHIDEVPLQMLWPLSDWQVTQLNSQAKRFGANWFTHTASRIQPHEDLSAVQVISDTGAFTDGVAFETEAAMRPAMSINIDTLKRFLELPAPAEAPNVHLRMPSVANATVTADGLTSSLDYSTTEFPDRWIHVDPSSAFWQDIPRDGTGYRFRIRATSGRPASLATNWLYPCAIAVDYIHELFVGLTAGQSYAVFPEGSNLQIDAVTSDGSGSAPISDDVSQHANLRLVNLSGSSEVLNVSINPRPARPFIEFKRGSETVENAQGEKIEVRLVEATDLTDKLEFLYSGNFTGAWEKVNLDDARWQSQNLANDPGSYRFRVSATDSTFASYVTNEVAVHPIEEQHLNEIEQRILDGIHNSKPSKTSLCGEVFDVIGIHKDNIVAGIAPANNDIVTLLLNAESFDVRLRGSFSSIADQNMQVLNQAVSCKDGKSAEQLGIIGRGDAGAAGSPNHYFWQLSSSEASNLPLNALLFGADYWLRDSVTNGATHSFVTSGGSIDTYGAETYETKATRPALYLSLNSLQHAGLLEN